MLNPNYVEPPTHITRENIKQYAKDRHNIGSKKELSEIDREKWDTEKLKNDTKDNIIEFTNNTKTGIQNVSNKTKTRFSRFIEKFSKKNRESNWLK